MTQEIVICFWKTGAHVGRITPERWILWIDIWSDLHSGLCKNQVFFQRGEFSLLVPNKYINVPQSNLHGIDLLSIIGMGT